MTTFDQWSVVVVNVPYTDGTGFKPRPALVVSAETFHRGLPDLLVCPISSQPRYFEKPGPGDCPMAGWEKVALRHPSTVRVSKLLSVDKTIIKRVLGTVIPEDARKVEKSLRTALNLV